MSHLSRRAGSVNWYYRESIPQDIRDLLMQRKGSAPREVWVSLGTPDLRIAKAKLPFVRAEKHREWADLRAAVAPLGKVPSTAEMTEAVVDFVHKQFISGHRAKLAAVLQSGADASMEAKRRLEKFIQADLYPTPDDVAAMELVARTLCRQLQWDIGPGVGVKGERWTELVEMVTKAIQHARGEVLGTLEGRPHLADRDTVIQQIGGRKRHATAKHGETLLELFAIYKDDCLRAGKSADTLDTESKVIQHFASFVGKDRSVSTIGRPDVRDFRRALLRVPHRWVTKPELKGMSLAEAATEWDKLGGAGRSPRTIARELSAVSSLFRWLIDNAYVDDENPTAGFRPKYEKRETKYPPYTDAQLKVLFTSPLFTGCQKDNPHEAGQHQVRDWRYWLPLCALYSGARAGEIAQLLCSDIRQEDGVWVFDFNENTQGETSKSLKTLSSRRLVPVHSALFTLGFDKYVDGARRAGHIQLFPEIKPGPRRDMSYMPSKFWQRYLKRIDLKARGLGLHSFRHTFADECRRRGVAKDLQKALLGHADSSITAHYGTLADGTLQQRTAAVRSLSYGGLHADAGPAVNAGDRAAA